MTRFCLVRHGQTDWNIEGRYHGQSDIPLNESGRVQANKLALDLQGIAFAAIYSSDLRRASETADIIAEVLHLPVTLEPRFREINQGEWEGQRVDQIKTRYSTLWKERMSSPENLRPPGGETVREVAVRVHSGLDDIAKIFPHESVLICSHGLALATIICMVNNIPPGHAYSMIPENAHPIWVDWFLHQSAQ